MSTKARPEKSEWGICLRNPARALLCSMLSMARVSFFLGLVVSAWVPCSLAWADLPPPGIEECGGKAVGTPCVTSNPPGTAGVCQNTTCTRLDYSQGTPPRSVTEPCVRCLLEGTDAASPATGANPDGSPAVPPGPGTSVDASGPVTSPVDGATSSASGSDGGSLSTGSSAGKSGCSLANAAFNGPATLLIMAALPLALRRRSRDD